MDIKTAEAYNKQLGELKAKAEKLQSAQGVYQSQLEDSCKKLTELLGIQVTPENLEHVYSEYMAKVENTVQAGMEIMRRIQARQAQAGEGQTVGTETQQAIVSGQQAQVGDQQTPGAVVTEVSGMEATVFTAPATPVSSPAPSVFEQAPAPTVIPPAPAPVTPTEPVAPAQGPLLWGGGTVGQDGHTWGSPEGQGGMIQI